jgi:nucleoside-diphosphate-sugar epimerase
VVLPLVYVEDVVDALLLAAASDVFDGSILHVADAAAVTQDALARRHLAADGAGGSVIHLPLAAVYPVTLGVDLLCRVLGRSAPLSIYRVRSALASLTCDCGAAEQRLGWRPRVGVQEGLRLTMEILRRSAAGRAANQ